jgi:hypothetical protein
MEQLTENSRNVAEVIAPAPQDIQTHLRRGKAYYEEGLFDQAMKEFTAILKAAPGHIETRVWVRKTKDARDTGRIEKTEAAGGKIKECLWMKLGMVSYRVCTNNYDCIACEFDQQMQEKMANSEADEVETTLKKFEQLPGNERVCRYALKGDVSFRLCSRCFRCATCEFAQVMEDAVQEKLVKLETRREALKKKAVK